MINSDQEIKTAAILFSINPWVLGGICIRTNDYVLKNNWLNFLTKISPPDFPSLQKIPFNIELDSLVGGVDVANSITTGNLVRKKGIFSRNKRQIFILKQANQLSDEIVNCICNEIDFEFSSKKFSREQNSIFVAFDESSVDCEQEEMAVIRDSLMDRFGLVLNFPILSSKKNFNWNFKPPVKRKLKKARDLLPNTKLTDDNLQTLAATSLVLGIKSLRPVIFAANAARVIAAYEERLQPNNDDISLAVRLVLLPRATQLPEENDNDLDNEDDDNTDENNDVDSNAEQTKNNNPTKEKESASSNESENLDSNISNSIDEKTVESVESKIPKDLLNELAKGEINFSNFKKEGGGKRGIEVQNKIGKGRFFGSIKSKPGYKNRLNLLETIKASIPYQKIRKKTSYCNKNLFINIQSEDFRVFRRKSRRLITTIFLVDASGSAAANRLGEAKGAVELLLSECYVRRDRVAVMTFRNTESELILPPTRSLVRAKKTLVGLPGGGGTPLATALDDCKILIENLLYENQTPLLVLLTDGGANVGKDGKGGREQAHADALLSAKEIKNLAIKSVFIDTSIISNEKAMTIAYSMGARYCPLPKANSLKIIEKITSH